ncbi:MAG: signal peptide peptidase SppA [Deltaproteobacteria bacterium]|nr:signal peptide peptidase SppA [Deltaproteobacteria bacterium]MBW2361768.1 signal peptide peptidase SppA [Deltaproteobacteria bacterium]
MRRDSAIDACFSDTPSRLVGPVVLMAALLLGGCVNLDMGNLRRGEMRESVVQGDAGPKILLLDIDGEITSADASGVLGWVIREGTVGRVQDQLELARKRDDIVAVLLRIDSPGGSPTASDAIYQQILAFKQESKLPVVAQFMSMGTSGAYFIAMAADEVVATRTSVTGSIGVILLGLNLSGLMEKVGVENQTMTSGDFKDAGSMFRPMTDEDRAQIQSVVDDLYVEFVSAVDAGRPKLDEEQVRKLADGRIYSARQALEAGLVDRIDSLEGSIDKLRLQLGAETVRVVAYHRRNESPSNIYSHSTVVEEIELSRDPLARIWPRPGFYYLWWPGAAMR